MINKIKALPPNKIPLHVAIIMDGNRRWARNKGFPVFYGHKKGVDTVKRIVEAARKIQIKYLTLYTFSTENWNRSKKEINMLFSLLKKCIFDYRDELKSNDISLKVSGAYKEFSSDLVKIIDDTISYLADCKSMVLNLALNYGGRKEIVDAVNKAIKDGVKVITEDEIEKRLYTYPLPFPDLIIRTSGEMRISNFLIWQSAYSEFYITKKTWPEFTEDDFYKAILEYSNRERRMGR
jgi:undecaprenyl diphosphate synthase